jgi:hypothetical protein
MEAHTQVPAEHKEISKEDTLPSEIAIPGEMETIIEDLPKISKKQ